MCANSRVVSGNNSSISFSLPSFKKICLSTCCRLSGFESDRVLQEGGARGTAKDTFQNRELMDQALNSTRKPSKALPQSAIGRKLRARSSAARFDRHGIAGACSMAIREQLSSRAAEAISARRRSHRLHHRLRESLRLVEFVGWGYC